MLVLLKKEVLNENIIGTENKVFRKFIEAQEKDIGIKIKSKGWK